MYRPMRATCASTRCRCPAASASAAASGCSGGVSNPCPDAGGDPLTESGAARTPEIVAALRARYPDMAIIATGGPTDESILATIEAGANAITYTPPSSASLFAKTMAANRSELE